MPISEPLEVHQLKKMQGENERASGTPSSKELRDQNRWLAHLAELLKGNTTPSQYASTSRGT
jgi:hypothetical protein